MTDLKHATSSHLRLCTESDVEVDKQRAPPPTQDELIRAIVARGIVPAELDSLCRSLPVAAEMGHRLPEALEDAVHHGRLNIIHTHGAWHMASPDLAAKGVRDRGGRAIETQPDVQSALPVPTAAADATEDQQRFQLAVLLDAAHEKALLFRVLIVLNVVGAMLLLREIFQ